MATLSGIVGTMLAPDMQLATLPVTTGICGIAAAAWPLAKLRRALGNKIVFTGALLWAAGGAGLAAWAINYDSFFGFCVATFLMGNNMAVIAQYRFAAAAMVPAHFVSRAISVVMVGTLLAAILAPWLALEYRATMSVDFAGSFAVLIAVYLATACLMMFLPLPAANSTHSAHDDGPPVREALRRPSIQLAIIAAAGGYGVMSLIMTATPISMHVMDQHSAEVTANVIRNHILAMFAPSLVSGWLIARFGINRMLFAGVVMESICIAIAVTGTGAWNYGAALIALGIGWNLLYVGGTTLLALDCTPDESAGLQGFNDLVMFSTMGLSSLAAGPLLTKVGWQWTNLAATLMLLFIFFALIRRTTPRASFRDAE